MSTAGNEYESKQEKMLRKLNEMRRTGIFCDIQVQCDMHTFTAHRCVLAAANEHLQTLMSDTTKVVFEVPGNASAMELMLDYIYEGKTTLTSEILNSVLFLTYQLQLYDFLSTYEQEIKSVIDKQNFISIWTTSYKHENKALQAAVIDYCRNHFTLLTEQGFINQCPPRMLYFIFAESNETPAALLQTLLLWYQNNPSGSKFILSFFLFTKLSKVDELELSLACKNSQFHLSSSIGQYFSRVLAEAKVYLASNDGQDLYENLDFIDHSETNDVPQLAEAFNLDVTSKSEIPPKLPDRNARTKPKKSTLHSSQLHPSLSRPNKSQHLKSYRRNTFSTCNVVQEAKREAMPPLPPMRWSSLPDLVECPQLLVFAVAKDKQVVLQRYNLKLKAWSAPQEFPLPRKYTTLPAIIVFGEMLYLLGGSENRFLNDVYCTSSNDLSYRTQSSLLLPRIHFGTVQLEDRLFAIGGRNLTGWLRDVECFDPVHNAWHQMAPLSEPKSAFAVTALNNAIYVTGGLKANQTFSYTTEQYDPQNDQWTLLEPIVHGRFRMGIGAIENEIYILGGTTINPTSSSEACSFFSYNINYDRWKSDATTRLFQHDQPCVATWNNQLWVLSRCSFKLNNYDPSTNKWTELEKSSFAKEWQFIKSVVLLYT